jgi:hypothetical protein
LARRWPLLVCIGICRLVAIVLGQTVVGVVLLLICLWEADLTVRWSLRNDVQWPRE